MAEKKSFIPFIGRIVFPRSTADLRSTSQCPACLSVLTSTVCARCGLDLNHPAAAELAAVSAKAAAVLDDRLELIGRIRFETDARRAQLAAPPVAPAAAFPPALAAELTTRATPTVAAPVVGAPANAVPTPSTVQTSTAPRRSSVQVALVIVGISLLSIFAIFGLVYAFINYGVLARSLIIGAITVAAFVAASLLRRRKLVATAEGVAALSVVLIYLDAWAVRVNDFFGLAARNGSTYWGFTLLITAIGFIAWNRLSRLRLPSIAAHTALVPGVAFLVGGILNIPGVDDAARVFSAAIVAATAGLAHRFTVRAARGTAPARAGTPERVLMLAFSGIALLTAIATSAGVFPNEKWTAAVAVAVVAIVSFAHTTALVTIAPSTPGPRVAAAFFAGFGSVSTVSIAIAAASRLDNVTVSFLAPIVASVAVGVGAEALGRRLRGTPAWPSALTATILAGVVGVSYAIGTGLVLAPTAVLALGSGFDSMRLGFLGAVIEQPFLGPFAVLALAVGGVLLTAGWAALRVLRSRGPYLLSYGALAALISVPQLHTLVPILIAFVALAAAAIAVLLARPTLGWRWRVPLIVLFAAAVIESYVVGWAGTQTWWMTSLTTVVFLVLARLIASPPGLRATLLGVGATIILFAASTLGGRLQDAGVSVTPSLIGVLAAAVLLALAAASRLPLSSLDRRFIFWPSAAFGGLLFAVSIFVAWTTTTPDATLTGPLGLTLEGGALIGAFFVWRSVRATSEFMPELVIAGLSMAPLLAWALVGLTDHVDVLGFQAAICPLIAAILVSAGALRFAFWPVAKRSNNGTLRIAADVGAALTSLAAIVLTISAELTISGQSIIAWLLILLAAVVVLLAATSRDGIVGSRSPRKHFGWVALALATISLWWRISESSVHDLELYVLPLAGALLLLALVTWQFGLRSEPTSRPRGAAVLFLAGLLVAIVPLAVVSGTGALLRPIAIGGAAAILVAVGVAVRRSTATSAYLDAVLAAGIAGVAVVAGARATALLRPDLALLSLPVWTFNQPGARLEAWIAPALLVLVVGAIGIVRAARASKLRSGISQAVLSATLLGVTIVESLATDSSTLGTVRAIALMCVLAATHVVAFWLDRAPATRLVAWVALGIGAVAAGAIITRNFVHPGELFTVPIAVALLATGAIHLVRVPASRSWPWLAPGLFVLLLPSLVAIYGHDAIWRILALGIAATASILVGLFAKLQAPFVIGVVVLLFHLVTQLWPGIRLVYNALPWWLWLGFAGLILVVLAARYERRINNLRSIALRIGSLR